MPEPVHDCLGCGEEYVRRVLRCPRCGTVGVQFLYKYCRFDVNALSGLVTRSLWCPNVASLNDPFEFAFAIEPNHLDGVPIDPDSMARAKEDMKQYGVLSFSEIGDDILMWSHYSSRMRKNTRKTAIVVERHSKTPMFVRVDPLAKGVPNPFSATC